MKSGLVICAALLVQGVLVPQTLLSQRIRPPEKVECSRDHLTSFTGKVVAYKRDANETFLRIRTDEETTEAFTLRHPGRRSAVERFLLRGQRFEPTDWKQIEQRKGKLHPRMRATVWVCDDESQPIVDWQPPPE